MHNTPEQLGKKKIFALKTAGAKKYFWIVSTQQQEVIENMYTATRKSANALTAFPSRKSQLSLASSFCAIAIIPASSVAAIAAVAVVVRLP